MRGRLILAGLSAALALAPSAGAVETARIQAVLNRDGTGGMVVNSQSNTAQRDLVLAAMPRRDLLYPIPGSTHR